MKRLIQLSAVLLLITCAAWASEPDMTARAAVLKAENDWKVAVLTSNRSALENLMAADLSYTHSSAKTQTKEQFIQDATGGATTYKSIDFENTKLRQYGSVMVIVQTAVIVTVQTGSSHLYLTEVWAQQGNQWQMASRQATKLP